MKARARWYDPAVTGDRGPSSHGLARWFGRLRRRLDPEGEAMARPSIWLAHKMPDVFERVQQQWAEWARLQLEIDSSIAGWAPDTHVGWMRRATTRQRGRSQQRDAEARGPGGRTAEASSGLGNAWSLVRSTLPIVVGPWTGEVGFELLYWIPSFKPFDSIRHRS